MTINSGKLSTKCVVQPLLLTDGSFDFDDKNITSMLEKVHIKRGDTNTSTIFDEQFYNNVNNEITSLIEAEKQLLSSGQLEHAEPYNADISPNQVRSTFLSTKGKFTPGPDNILPKMLSEEEDTLLEPTTKLFQLCWENGVNPQLWNRDNKIYLPKPGKDDYNIPKSYRPNSLTSVVGKMMERIVNQRLVWWLESQL